MAALTTSLLVGSLALQAGAGVAQAGAQRAAGRQANADAQTEADMQEAATRQADLEAREQIRRTRREQKSFVGSQRAAVAASGTVGSTGSPLDILGRTAALQELQIQDMARRASAEYSAGYARARQIRVAGRAAETGANRAAIGTLVGTGANLASGIGTGYEKGIFKFGKAKTLVPPV